MLERGTVCPPGRDAGVASKRCRTNCARGSRQAALGQWEAASGQTGRGCWPRPSKTSRAPSDLKATLYRITEKAAIVTSGSVKSRPRLCRRSLDLGEDYADQRRARSEGAVRQSVEKNLVRKHASSLDKNRVSTVATPVPMRRDIACEVDGAPAKCMAQPCSLAVRPRRMAVPSPWVPASDAADHRCTGR